MLFTPIIVSNDECLATTVDGHDSKSAVVEGGVGPLLAKQQRSILGSEHRFRSQLATKTVSLTEHHTREDSSLENRLGELEPVAPPQKKQPGAETAKTAAAWKGDAVSCDVFSLIAMTDEQRHKLQAQHRDSTHLNESCIHCGKQTIVGHANPKDGTHSCEECGAVQPSTQKIARNRNGGCPDESEDATVRGDVCYTVPKPTNTKRGVLENQFLQHTGQRFGSTNVPAVLQRVNMAVAARAFREQTQNVDSRCQLICTRAFNELKSLVEKQLRSHPPSLQLQELVQRTIQQFVFRMTSHLVVCVDSSKCTVNVSSWSIRSIMLVCFCMCIEDCIRCANDNTNNRQMSQSSNFTLPSECDNLDVMRRLFDSVRSNVSKRELEVNTLCQIARQLMTMRQPGVRCNHGLSTNNLLSVDVADSVGFKSNSNFLQQSYRDGCNGDSDDTSSISSRSTNPNELLSLNSLRTNSPSPLMRVRSSSALTVGSNPSNPSNPSIPSIPSISSTSAPTSPIMPSTNSKNVTTALPSAFAFKRALADVKRKNQDLSKHTIANAQANLSKQNLIREMAQLCVNEHKTVEQVVLDYCYRVQRTNNNEDEEEEDCSPNGRDSPTKRVRFHPLSL